jgi:hypothetical protein
MLTIDGSVKGKYRGFTIIGDGTGILGNNALPNAINLTWTTAASRSTSADVFDDIYVRNLRFSCGMRMGAPPGTTRQVDGTTIRDGSGSAIYNYSTLSLYGFYFGNGISGDQYDYTVYNSSASGCQAGVYCDTSGFEWYGGQPAQNGTEFYFQAPPARPPYRGSSRRTLASSFRSPVEVPPPRFPSAMSCSLPAIL